MSTANSRGRVGTASKDASGGVFHGAINANPLQASAMFHGQTATFRASTKGEKAKRIPAWSANADQAANLRVAGTTASAAVPISRAAMPATANETISRGSEIGSAITSRGPASFMKSGLSTLWRPAKNQREMRLTRPT